MFWEKSKKIFNYLRIFACSKITTNLYFTFMELLYLNEHRTCKNYISDFKTGFSLKTFKKDDIFNFNLFREFVVIFLEQGSLLINNSEESKIISANEICLLSNHASYECKAIENSIMTLLFFDHPNNQCDKYSLQALTKYSKPSTEKIRSLPMKTPIIAFINGMKLYLSNKMYCNHLHDIKESEWFFIMRGFYTKEESAYFFNPVINIFSDLFNLVKENYLQVKSVQELADICNMTIKTFTRHFKEEFNDTPKQWILKEKAKHIHIDLAKKELNKNEVSYKFGFHSSSHLNHYLKAQYDKK